MLHNDALPFYCEQDLEVDATLIDDGCDFCGKDCPPFELYLALNDIEHRTTRAWHPGTNGLVERFNRTTKNEKYSEGPASWEGLYGN